MINTDFRVKLIIFDIDNTLTIDNSWERLNYTAGITEAEDEKLYTDYYNGGITYEAWIAELHRLYKARQRLTKTNAELALRSFVLRPETG
jgi:phosphoserine phosphatase